jgi:hypothetical protein
LGGDQRPPGGIRGDLGPCGSMARDSLTIVA